MMEYIRTLSKAELDRLIALLGRAAERLPDLREAILLERSRLERVLAQKREASACSEKTGPVQLSFVGEK